MAVPYTFGSATTSIPLSQLDSNFATTITLGNTAIQLGNTVTTLNNMTLASPTLTTPALGTPASGVMTNVTGIPAGQITGSQAIPKSTLPTGSVLQVVQTVYSTVQSTSGSTALFDSGLTATITPTSSTSKILILVSQNVEFYINSSQGQYVNMNICRGSSSVSNFTSCAYSQFTPGSNGYQDSFQTVSLQYLDSPATTSSTTYKTQGSITNVSSTAGLRFQNNGGISTMTLLEIAA